MTVEQTPEPVHVTRRHIAALDGVRGIAILVVVIHNASWVLAPSDQVGMKLLSAVTATGWIGVELFFVLSGFLITGILLDSRRSPRYFRSFYTRRVLRIFPLYYAFLAVAFGIAPLLTSPAWAAAARQNEVWYWTYLSNWTNPFGLDIPALPHFWSLAVEEQFYLLWPLLVYVMAPRRTAWLCLGIVLAGPFVRLGLHLAGLPALAGYEFTIARWDALAVGGLLAVLIADEGGRRWLSSHMRPIGFAGLGALAVFLFFDHGFHEDDLAVQILGQSIMVVLFGWLVYAGAVQRPGGSTGGGTLTSRWLRFLGKYSYAIYVFHYPVHTIASLYLRDVVNGPDTSWRLLRWALYVAGVAFVSILLALASWRVLEKPFLDLKDRLAPRGEAARQLERVRATG